MPYRTLHSPTGPFLVGGEDVGKGAVSARPSGCPCLPHPFLPAFVLPFVPESFMATPATACYRAGEIRCREGG